MLFQHDFLQGTDFLINILLKQITVFVMAKAKTVKISLIAAEE